MNHKIEFTYTGSETIPQNVTHLYCTGKKLSHLPPLPPNLIYLNCAYNRLTTLSLPSKLIYLSCANNQLTNLSPLPPKLIYFICYNNQLTTLPTLPDTLK